MGITDPRKAPNHSWTHRFKGKGSASWDECCAVEIEPIHGALTGRASSA
jgi:hypothetical protein